MSTVSRNDVIGVLMETIAPPSVTLDTLVMRIDALPSAERTGRWLHYRTKNGIIRHECSACGDSFTTCDTYGMYYCSNCGARMIKEDE